MDRLKLILNHLSRWGCIPRKRNNDILAHDKPAEKLDYHTQSTSSQPEHHPPVTLVVSHGAFQTQFHYQAFLDAANKTSTFSHTLVPQQSSSGPSPPADSYAKDVGMLHDTISTELLKGRDVLLVCHSYGGIPGCEALSNLPEEANKGIRLGKILGVVFVSAFVAEEGQSLATARIPGSGRATWVRNEGTLSYVNSPATTLFSLMPPSTSAPYITALVPQASSSFLTPSATANWRHHSPVYVRCLRDEAMPAAEQDFFIQRLQASGRECEVLVRDLESDHMPFASATGALVGVLQGVVREFQMK